MSQKPKTYFNWSSGKDSAMALHYLLEQGNYDIDRLLTTVNAHYNRVSMHGLPRKVLESQAASVGIPLEVLEVPEKPSMEQYNDLMRSTVTQLRDYGYTHTGFGDIFLEDLKQYRENMLQPYGLTTLFPLWKKDTSELIEEFLALRFRAVIICVNNSKLDASFLGQELSRELIAEFPSNVDPCGENGEYHTFCFDGPIFKTPIPFSVGEKVFKAYDDPSNSSKSIQFGFCDIELETL
ncbi:diphthine--ammonia ligase [Muricauda sp. ANG21]|uniref:Dph6-related ATP pyrophosphatase n=1 Tax=Allomuricauda sp. ANG21 TaxID=3042468 RepID=UPI0034564E50